MKDRGEPRQTDRRTDGRRQGHRRQLRMSAEDERGAKNEVKLKPRRRRQKQTEERTSREGQNLPNNPEDLAPRRFPAAAAWTAFAFVDQVRLLPVPPGAVVQIEKSQRANPPFEGSMFDFHTAAVCYYLQLT